MSKDSDHLRWTILSDQEVARQRDDAFGVHSAYAKLLLQLAKDSPTPFSIGLYSGWGTGKTSIVRILQELVKSQAETEVALIYLDVWKYSADPLKRWILFETERQLGDHGLTEDYKFEGRTLQSHLEYEEELEEKGHVEIDFKNLGFVVLLASLIAIACFIGWFYVPSSWFFISFILAIAGGGSTIALILAGAVKKIGESVSGLLFRRTIKHVSAKPTFSSEKFSQIFRDLVEAVRPRRRLVFVFDNLDRCPADVAIEAIGVIKTFLDEPGCVYVVPCDEEALLAHIKGNFRLRDDDEASEVSELQANQFLAKLFQMTLRLPPAADFAVEEYVEKELAEARMGDLSTEARDVLVLGYRGETPRQVKRILNDLIGYRGIAEQIEEAGLVDAGTLTADVGHLTKMAVLSAKWPSFMRRLANDPALWTDVMQRIRNDSGPMNDIEPDLAQFLWNTRLVSPDTDIRPWLYLRTGSHERDTVLNRKIESILQDGAWKQMIEMLADESFKDRTSQILDIVSATVRRWLARGRRLLLRNAGPVVLKAALTQPASADIRRAALDVLDFLTNNASPDEMEQLFDVSDIMSLTKDFPAFQRDKLLTKYAELSDAKYPTSDARIEIWKKLIERGELLSPVDRGTIRSNLAARYTMHPNGEQEVLGLLQFAAEGTDRRWCVTGELLAAVAGNTVFDESEIDKKRVAALIAFRSIQNKPGLDLVFAKIAAAVAPARVTNVDVQARLAISAFLRYDSNLLRGRSDAIANNLLAQATRAPITARTWWVLGLLHLYPTLDENLIQQVDALFKATIVDSDPGEAAKFIASLHEGWRSNLLKFERFNAALHGQPSSYNGRYGANAPAHRQQFLSNFAATDLIRHVEIFDAGFSWDLAICLDMVGKALEDNKISREEAGRFAKSISADYLPSKLEANKELYTSLTSLLSKHPEVVSVDLSDIVAVCQLAKLLSGEHSAYPLFKQFRSNLSQGRQVALTRELLVSFSSRPKQWINLLELVVEDLSTADNPCRQDGQLCKDVADFAFVGAREDWTHIGSTLHKAVQLLDEGDRLDYIDRAVDTLISLEPDREGWPKMEPFLNLVANNAEAVKDALGSKVEKFVHRMLGAAKPDEEKVRTLDFVLALGPARLPEVKEYLEPLSKSSDSRIVEKVAMLLKTLEQAG